jgi:hypothetical protein
MRMMRMEKKSVEGLITNLSPKRLVVCFQTQPSLPKTATTKREGTSNIGTTTIRGGISW